MRARITRAVMCAVVALLVVREMARERHKRKQARIWAAARDAR